MRDFLAAFSLKRNLTGLLRLPEGSLSVYDGLRALSILWVVLHHTLVFAAIFQPEAVRAVASGLPGRFILNGDLGVDIFFMLSGALITDLLVGGFKKVGKIDFKTFYVRRALRLLPPYYFLLFVWCVLWRATNYQTVWANLLYVNNYLPRARQCLEFTWSLAIEEQFYLIFPFMLAWALSRPKRLWPMLWGVLAASVVTAYAVVHAHQLTLPTAWLDGLFPSASVDTWFDGFYDKSYARFGALWIGVIATCLRRFADAPAVLARFPRLAGAGVLVALTLVLGIALGPGRDPAVTLAGPGGMAYVAWSRDVLALGVAYLLLASFADLPLIRPVRAFLSLSLWRPFAQLAYGGYLLHTFVAYRVLSAWAKAPVALDLPEICLLFAKTAGLTFGVATVLYLVIERPFMNLRSVQLSLFQSFKAANSGKPRVVRYFR